MAETVREEARAVPVVADVDVLVAGGGPAGVAAAFAAARLGAKTLVVEQFNCLGGVATAGGHGHICLYSSWASPPPPDVEVVVGGVMREIAERVVKAGFGAFDGRQLDFEVEGLKLVLEEMAAEAGVGLLYHTFAAGARVEDGAVAGLFVQNKTGRGFVRARRLVDATGDGDVAASAGCPFEQGNENGRCQPVTLMFTIGGVDIDRVRAFQKAQPDGDFRLDGVWRRAQAAGDMRPFQTRLMGWWWTPTRPDQFGVNFTHVTGVDTTKAEDLTRATIEARRQVYETIEVYRKYVPGLERCHLLSTPNTIGTRESRRILGEHVLTKEDVLGERTWPDSIGYGSFFIDIHNVDGPGMDRKTVRPRSGFKYQIPYRILVPRGVENLLVAGRCASCTHEALGSLRVMPQCGVMGQAAGTAAALSLGAGVPPRRLDIATLQRALREAGALLDEADIARARGRLLPAMPTPEERRHASGATRGASAR